MQIHAKHDARVVTPRWLAGPTCGFRWRALSRQQRHVRAGPGRAPAAHGRGDHHRGRCLLVVPPFTHLLPGGWGDAVERHFTSSVGQQITAVTQDVNALSPWNGYLVFTLWWASSWPVRRTCWTAATP